MEWAFYAMLKWQFVFFSSGVVREFYKIVLPLHPFFEKGEIWGI